MSGLPESGHGWSAPPKGSASADPACGCKPRVPHRDGTHLNSDAGATHKATRRTSSLACPINRQSTYRLTLLCPLGRRLDVSLPLPQHGVRVLQLQALTETAARC